MLFPCERSHLGSGFEKHPFFQFTLCIVERKMEIKQLYSHSVLIFLKPGFLKEDGMTRRYTDHCHTTYNSSSLSVHRTSTSTYTKLCSASSAPRTTTRAFWPGTLMGPWRQCQTSLTKQRAWSRWSKRGLSGTWSWAEGFVWVQTLCKVPEPYEGGT